MNATCQVSYAANGRIRLEIPSIRRQPQIAEVLVAILLQQRGVTGVQTLHSTGSIVIRYDPRICTQVSILEAVGLRQLADPDAPEPPLVVPTPRPRSPYADCQVRHEVPGRVRLQIAILKNQSTYASALASFLSQQVGIERVRLSRPSESIIVNYDQDAWDTNALVTLVTAYDPEAEALQRWADTEWEPEPDNAARLKLAKAEVALAATALGLSLTVGAPAFLPVLALLTASGQTIGYRARRALFKEKRLTVDVLDATACMVLFSQGMLWQVALLNTLISGGEWIRSTTQERARKELSEVLEYMVDEAWVMQDGQIVSLPLRDIRVGDTVYVFPGERVPVDGLVLSGKGLVDQHALTGESMPVEKVEHDEVYAATVLSEGELHICATCIGSDTQVGRVVQLVQSAPVFDTRAQDYAERWANKIVPYSLFGAGVLALLGNYTAAATLLVIDYAAGFKVAAPTAVMSTMTRAARQGIFIRGGRHVELLAQVDAVIFDKTGTLTMGSPDVVEVVCTTDAMDAEQVLALAASAEQFLTHPVAQAVVNAASRRNLAIPERDDFGYQIGQGVVAHISGLSVAVGTQRFLQGRAVIFSPEAEQTLWRIEDHAISPLCVAVDDRLVGILGLADPIRPESANVVQSLLDLGVRAIVMLTGDRAAVARSVSDRLGIERYVAEAFPSDKLAMVRRLQEEGYTVAVVGDGINDSPALAQANVGIAVNGGTALAQETADVVILKGDLGKLVDAIQIARDGVALIKQNWDMIRVPNTLGLGLAFAGAIGPLGASLISDGAALTAGANSLRPLMTGSSKHTHESSAGAPEPTAGTS
jgi:manganese/zinc-transporting P-type ATPase C